MSDVTYLIVTGYATRGQQIVTAQRKKMLEELGYTSSVHCLADRSTYPVSKKLTNRIVIPGFFQRHTKILHFLKTAYTYRRNLERYLEQIKPDIIEFYCPEALILQNKKIFDSYQIVASFDLPFGAKRFIGSNILSYLEKKRYHQADLIFSLTNFGKQLLVEKYGIEERKIAHIPYAYDSTEIKKYKSSDKGYAVSYCSNIMMWRKGLDILIKAWKMTHKNKKLVVTGLKKLDAEYFLNKMDIEIPNNIEFVGMLSREKYLKTLSNSSFFISSTRWEDFGQVVIEALALGKVVVSTPTIGPTEILHKIDKNLISPSFSPSKLAKTIRYAELHLNDYVLKKNIRKVIYGYEYSHVKSEIKEYVRKFLGGQDED
ncbi:MAG: glycosyltransferase family 4 protein [Candidatus Hodarchaeales archaeon]|jgi:glycosyltransferase involved in cell wall biosynthesis